jgi:hypothetical protein
LSDAYMFYFVLCKYNIQIIFVYTTISDGTLHFVSLR